MAAASSNARSSLQTCSIVIVGNFNPIIFHPKWFSSNEIISESDVESAEVEVVHSQLAAFNLGWLVVRVEPTRFIAEVQQPPYIRLQDFVIKTFRDALSHTPCRQVGMNLRTRISMETYEKRDRVGRKIAPIEPWGEWGDLMDAVPADNVDHGGVLSQRMRIPRVSEEGELKGFTGVTVEPTGEVPRGVSILVNCHYAIDADNDDIVGAEKIIGTIERNFDSSIDLGERITSHIVSLGES